ncbi:MAG: cohesin domain-containing protein [bacterium]
MILFLLIGTFFFSKRRKDDGEKLTIPPIDKFYTDHNYQAPPSFVVDAALFFDNESIETFVGKDFNLVAKIDPGSNVEKGINAVQLDFDFDGSKLEFFGATAMEPFAQMGSSVVDNQRGIVSMTFFIGGSQLKNVSDVAKLSFRAKLASDETVIAFSQTAQAAANDGSGSMVLGVRGKTTVKISK